MSYARALATSLAVLAAATLALAPPPGRPTADVSDTLADDESGIRLDFTVHGGTVTEAAADVGEYTIRGTVRPGETISVAASGNGTTFSSWHHVNEDRDATLAIDVPGSDHDEFVTIPAGSGGSAGASYVVGRADATVDVVVSIGNVWVNPYGGGSRTLTVRCHFDVVDDGGPSVPDADVDPPPPSPSPTPDALCDSPDDAVPTSSAVVRFGDLHGEVNVRPNWEDDDAYIFAELSTPLQHCDRIRTLRRSGAILSFADMSTFVLREDTAIVLDIANERRSNLAHLAGVVWVNVNRMVEGRELQVEMSQAIAGARGTTFICEETGDTSTIKVLEGAVEVTPRVGPPVVVTDGRTVTVTPEGAGRVLAFDVAAEMAGWPAPVQDRTAEALAAADRAGPGGRAGAAAVPPATLVLVVLAGLLGLGAITTGVVGLVRSARPARPRP